MNEGIKYVFSGILIFAVCAALGVYGEMNHAGDERFIGATETIAQHGIVFGVILVMLGGIDLFFAFKKYRRRNRH